MKKFAKLNGALAGALLYAFVVPAFAQDASSGDDKRANSDRDAAVQTVPTWESFGAGDSETLEETFFRLSRDFVTTSDLSIQRLGAVPIWPRGELRILGVRLLPFAREGVEWDDNYYRQPETGPAGHNHGRQAVWSHINEAGVLGDADLMGGRLKVALSLDSTWNVRYGNDAPPDTWDFNGQLGATYRMDSGAWVAAGLTYERRHDAADLPLLANDFGRTRKGTFVNGGFDHDIFFGSKMKFEFGVQTDKYAAMDPVFNTLDRTETIIYGKVSYPFLKDTTRIFLLGREQIANRNSSRINDGKSFGLSAGLDGSIPLREGEYRGLRGQVSVGFDSALYDNQTFTSGSQTLVADDSGRKATTANIQVALQYIMSPKTSVDLRYLHQTEFSFRGNYQVVDHVEFTMSHNFTRQWTGRVQLYAEHTDPSGKSPNQSIPSNSIAVSSHDVNREGAGAGVRYAINDWMDIDFTANVENRNDHAVSFKNYQGILGLTFYLNALVPKSRVPGQP